MACPSCEPVNQTFEIERPGDLTEALRIVRESLGEGILIQSNYNGSDNQPAKFEDVPDKGPWEDSILYYFECPKCAQLFALSAETYHGRGGRWAPAGKE